MAEAAQLLRMLVKMETAQAILQIVRLLATARPTFLLYTLRPEISTHAAEAFGALLEGALTSIMAGEEAAKMGLASPEDEASDADSCRRHLLAELEALS